MSHLTRNETVLSVIAFVVVTASIGLALCIGLLLPRHWTSDEYVGKKHDKSSEEMAVRSCGCDRKKITTNYINCIPRTFSDRVLHYTNNTADGNKPEKVCDLVHDYPYVVSLHIAAYKDDHEERRFACSGTILTETWILIGGDCVHDESEFRAVKLRVGSTYWSKGGKEYPLGAIAKFSDEGPIAVKVEKPMEFDKYVNAVKLPKNGIYTAWITAETVEWRKGHGRKYEQFFVQKWSTTPCKDRCYKGEVRANPDCSKKNFGRALVAQNELLVGIQTGTCNSGNASKIMFVDVQTEDYQAWFEYLVGEHEEPDVQTPLQPSQRKLNGTTPSPFNIYEVGGCAEFYVDISSGTDDKKNNSVDGNIIQSNTASEKTKEPETSKKTKTTPKRFISTYRTKKLKVTKPTEHPEESEQTENSEHTEISEHTKKFERTEVSEHSETFELTEKSEQTERTEGRPPPVLFSTDEDDFIVPDEETSKSSSLEISTYLNPTIFPPLSKLSELMAGLKNKPRSRIDGADEYGDSNYDRDEDAVVEGRLPMPWSTVIPNEVNYSYH